MSAPVNGYPSGSWRVWFRRCRDKAERMVVMAYPEQQFYTDDELDACTLQPEVKVSQ